MEACFLLPALNLARMGEGKMMMSLRPQGEWGFCVRVVSLSETKLSELCDVECTGSSSCKRSRSRTRVLRDV